jgi:hypothetical protein
MVRNQSMDSHCTASVTRAVLALTLSSAVPAGNAPGAGLFAACCDEQPAPTIITTATARTNDLPFATLSLFASLLGQI